MFKCIQCKKDKNTADFYKNKARKRGHIATCKQCFNKIGKAKKYKRFDSEYMKSHRGKISSEAYQRKVKKVKEMRHVFKQKYGIGFGSAWRVGIETATALVKRDGAKCRLCGSTLDLTINHIDGNGRHNYERGEKMNNDIQNLEILCRKCHGSIDGKRK